MRRAKITRETKETFVEVELDLDGRGEAEIDTPLRLFSHMLSLLCFFSMTDIKLTSKGDISHHLIEDTGVVLGTAMRKALGSGEGINRFGYCVTPMDDALVMVAVDLGGRAHCDLDVSLRRERVEDTASEDLLHFLRSLSASGRFNLHVKKVSGENDHHVLEACFKGIGLALRQALAEDPRRRMVPSTKGVI